MKRCYFRSLPQLNLSICNGQILIRTAQYTVHHHEILDCRPHTVRVQEVHSMHSNMEGVMAVSRCIFPVSFYCIESFQFCTLAFQYNMYHFRQYQPSDVLSVHSRGSSLCPITINFYLVDGCNNNHLFKERPRIKDNVGVKTNICLQGCRSRYNLEGGTKKEFQSRSTYRLGTEGGGVVVSSQCCI